MARGKKGDTSSVSDPSDAEFDSDNSMKDSRPQKKKVVKKEQPKTKTAPKKANDMKEKKTKREEEEGGSNQMDIDSDDEQKTLAEGEEEDLLSIQVPDKPIPCMAVEGGQRLMITDITTENFKSYYGTRVIGPFHQSFSSIIGPNGSGKSNVIDALLFVFGYKASKIRSKKVSVLIHSSSGKDDLPSCTVKISFQKIIDNPDGTYDVVPNTDFYVSRTAYRNNSSDYKMNGKKVSFKEVAVQLKAVGIDLIHNRFLILQGEVEQIAMMKPKGQKEGEEGMLEYLEDIIGSSRFKVPIEKLDAHVKKLDATRLQQISKVNAAAKDKKALDEPVQLQLAYMTMQNETAALNCKQHLYSKYNAEDKLARIQPEKDLIQGELTKLTADLAELAGQLKEKKEASEKMTKELSALTSSIHKATNELENIVQKDKKRQNDLERVNKDMKKLEAEAKKENEKLEEVIRAPEVAEAKIEKLTADIEKQQEEMAQAQQKFDDNFPEYNKQTEKDRARKVKLEEEYSGIAARLADAAAECKLAESKLRNLMEDYEKKRAQLAELEQSMTTNQEKLDKDTQALTSLRAEMESNADATKTAAEEMKTIGARTDEIRKRLNELAPLFTEKHQEAAARQTNNRITQAFESAVSNGKMRGYIGQLCDLGSVDAKYDRAISNNFNLDMYLVEDGRTANEGSEILKRLSLRTNFLSLDKQQHLTPHLKKVEAEKNGAAPRLFNMIQCEEKYKPAFFFAVRGAYAVETMDDATALHQKLVRENRRGKESIVSMDGRGMIQWKGTYVGGGAIKEGKMATGSAKVARRASAVKEDEEALKKAQEAQREKQTLEQELQEIGQKRRELEAKLFQMEPKLRNHANAEATLVKQIKATEDRLRTQTEQRAEKEREAEKAKVDEETLQERRTEIDQLKKDKDAANEESKSFKAKIKLIDTEIAKVYDRLVEPYEAQVKKCSEEIAQWEKELGAQRGAILGAERNKAKQQKKVEDVERDVEQKRKKAEELTADEESFAENKVKRQEAIDSLEKEKTEAEANLKTMRTTAGELDTQEVAMRKQLRDLGDKVEEVDKRMRGFVKTIEEYDNRIAKLSLHNIAELLEDVPENMRTFDDARRYLIDGEEDDEVEDYAMFMITPARRRAFAETRPNLQPVKMSRLWPSDDEEDDEDGDDEEKQMKKEVNDEEEDEAMKTGSEDDAKTDSTQKEDEEPSTEAAAAEGGHTLQTSYQTPEPETVEQRRERKRQAMREEQNAWEAMLKKGEWPAWPRQHIQRVNMEGIKVSLDDLEKSMEKTKKQLVPHIIDDFKRKVKKLREESQLLTEINASFVAHRDRMDDLKDERLDEFMEGFDLIAASLRELYQMITLGGDASLELKDLTDPFQEGVQFMVRPPKKSWKQIENLSGGEKTLSSLALVFALHTFRPTPLYVMDEIDAALDFRNVSIIGHYIKDRTKNAQFIIISLRNNMFELADRLIGIYKVNDCTRNVVIDPKKVIENAENVDENDRVRQLMAKNTIKTGARRSVSKTLLVDRQVQP